MKLEIFKPSDFDKLIYDQYTWEPTDTLKPILCEFVNRKIQDYIETLPILYGYSSDLSGNSGAWTSVGIDSTHKARIICIEEIKRECEHYSSSFIMSNPRPHKGLPVPEVICDKCGLKLKATWSAV